MTQPLDDKTRIETDFQEYIIKCRASSGSIDQRRDRDRYFGYLAGATKERDRAKELVEALEKWEQTHKEFETGYRNVDGTMTRINIVQLSQACNEADKHLKTALANYKKQMI